MKIGTHLFLFKTILYKQTTKKHTLDKKVLLVQTDTTVGFLSQNHEALSSLKERKIEKPFVTVTASFKHLKTISRVPNAHKKRVRRAKESTFIYANNRAIRVINDEKHKAFIKPFVWMYSTSANEKGLCYDKEFAFGKSDIIVEDFRGLFEGESSSIYRLYQDKLQRLR